MDDKPVNLTWLMKTKTYPFPIPTYSEAKPRKLVKEKTGRPSQSLAVLIYEAFREYRCQLTVSQISESIAKKYEYYRIRKQWTITGTIRNALSKDTRFLKLPKDPSLGRRSNYWIINNKCLWQEIQKGTAPFIKNEDEFKSELGRRHESFAEIKQSYERFENQDVKSKPYEDSKPTHLDDIIDWIDVEVCKFGDDVDKEVEQILVSNDFLPQRQHPWAEDTNTECEWIF
ncbi:unnamed protein product [Bursaphelenchus xylophilus]|uniref:(pine wood nematode) hypothetical protein n=1 Tax=Bursaphelenchus xylophilus TaxID=6326 RepID=A0A1I7STY8_BURXY|nr:unnamed protein product [Bursaphelenchus xylophilus]CAG9107794.1 unnamed protein product [Bursaphelenchus xylophilus]